MTSDEKVASILSYSEIQEFLAGKDRFFVEDFKCFLQDVVAARDSYFDRGTIDIVNPNGNPEQWIADVKQVAGKYMEQTRLHNPWLTKYLIRELANCHVEGLAYQRSRGIYPEYHWRNSLSEPYRKIVPPVLGVAFFLCLMALLVYLLEYDHLALAALVGIYVVYHYVLKIMQAISRAKVRRKLFEYIEMLSIITHDIVATDSYDADTIIRRLRACEEKGLYPYGVIFPLLELRKKELAAGGVAT